MIPRAHIVAWRSQAPWALDSQVEQDLALSRAIIDLFGEPTVSAELAMRGGTVLHKVSREMSANLEAKLADPLFLGDLGPLLAPGVTFDVGAAASRVRDELIDRIR